MAEETAAPAPKAEAAPKEWSKPETPVRMLPFEETEPEPTDGIGLCLSGGGYRAMIFHLGALRRLNEAGWLARLDRVSSVSGGSIAAAQLALAWERLGFGEDGVAANLEDEVVEPVRELARHTIDVAAVLRGVLGPETIAERAAATYDRRLFGDATLQDLPDEPRFVFNATSVQTGGLWRFGKDYMADWRVGRVREPDVPVADAVAASAGFPPVLSPFVLDLRQADWVTDEWNHLTEGGFRDRVVLSDGGVYDNLGLETAWKRCRTILVSDAGGQLEFETAPDRDWARHAVRSAKLVDQQVRDLRKRQVIGAYVRDERDGSYWGIRSDVTHYELPDALPCHAEATLALAEVPTRLARMSDLLQERLMNWGYAVCDAAMRAHVDNSLPAPADFPYPAAGVGE